MLASAALQSAEVRSAWALGVLSRRSSLVVGRPARAPAAGGGFPSRLADEMSLQEQIADTAAEINTDAYAMSIGEIINLYRDKELVIRPAFQRLFRWSPYQKSRFVESILLGIPIPSIFVSQREDGVWEVVDGLQRLSTILEFVGELRDPDGALLAPSTLVGTRYLPDLDERTFDKGEKALDSAIRIAFKRSKLDVKIVKEADASKTKYDLFDRLNSGGANLSDQEFRNSLIVMTDPTFMDWLEGLRANPQFQSTVAPSERQAKEQYDLELVVRYLTLQNRDEGALNRFKDLRELLTETSIQFAEDPAFDRHGQERLFSRMFTVLNAEPDVSVFRRHEPGSDRFLGNFSVSSYEVVTVGVASNIDLWEQAPPGKLRAKVASVWSHPTFKQYTGSGVPATTRVPRTVSLGRELFAAVG